MFKKLIKKAINFPYKHSALKSDVKQIHKNLLWAQKENACLQHLLNLLGSGSYLPQTEMTMSPVTVCHILNEIIINKRKNIIEFGSGNSTVYIAKIIKSLGLQAKFYSVDSDAVWISNVTESLAGIRVQDAVEFIYVPVTETEQYVSVLAPSFKWYDAGALQQRTLSEKFDLVIVDGPTGNLCPFSRYPAIPFLLNNLADSYSIFLDDVGRSDEEKILKAWADLLKQNIIEQNIRYACISKNAGFITKP